MALLGVGIALILVGSLLAGWWRRYDEWPGVGVVVLGLVLVTVAVVRQPGFGASAPSVAAGPTTAPTTAAASPGATGRPARPVTGRLTAVCRDGRPSYSTTVRGTCARDGGVARWVHRPAA